MMRTRPITFLICAALVLAPSLAAAQDESLVPSARLDRDELGSALGADGTLYRASIGIRGELFPSDAEAVGASAPVIALEALTSDRVNRWLVPGTESPDLETSVSLVYSAANDAVHIVWSTNYNVVHSKITLLQFQQGDWGEPIEILSDPFSLKTSPRIAVTREGFTVTDGSPGAGPGAGVEHYRTIVHTLWWEEGGLGERVVYSPLVFVDGEFSGETPLIPLTDLDVATPAGVAVQHELAVAPSLERGATPRRLLVSLANSGTGRLSVVEIEPVPFEIIRLAESARAHIVEVGSRACAEGGAAEAAVKVADSARAHIVEVGRRDFHSSLIKHVAAVAADGLGETTACGAALDSVARDTERRVLESATEALHDGLLRTASSARAHIVEVGRSPGLGLSHRIRIQTMSSREAPETGPSQTWVFASRDGRESLVAWRVDGAIVFVESAGAGWSEPTELKLDNELAPEQALLALGRRIAER